MFLHKMKEYVIKHKSMVSLTGILVKSEEMSKQAITTLSALMLADKSSWIKEGIFDDGRIG